MTCNGKTKDNKRCSANAINGSDKCFFHAEGKDSERLEARKKGGKSTVARFIGIAHLPEDTPDFSLESVEDARALLGKVANYVLRGQVAAQIANSVAYLVATSIRAKEAADFEQQLAEVRQQIKELKDSIGMRK